MIKASLIITFLLLYQPNTFSQKQSTSNSFSLIGKWIACDSFIFSRDFNCKNEDIRYEFFANGTFKNPHPSKDGDGDHPFSMGEWKYKDNVLTIDFYDTPYSKNPPRSIRIIIINTTKFYSSGQEGENGPVAFTYFQKVN